MSARKAAASSVDQQRHQVTVQARQSRLSLSPDSIVFHKNGIEFRCESPFPVWTEMTLMLESPGETGRIHCNGVVISCSGNKHFGYHVSMVFTGLSKQAEARLSLMASSQLF